MNVSGGNIAAGQSCSHLEAELTTKTMSPLTLHCLSFPKCSTPLQ